MEKAMAPHSSTLAWKIPWTEEPGGLHKYKLEDVAQLKNSKIRFMKLFLMCKKKYKSV